MVHERRTKIVCTLGPATRSPDAIAGLVAAGMDVARLNFSHGSRDDHAEIYGRVRDASDAAGRAVSILVDLQGPKIRLGCFDGGFAVLEPGSVFTVTAEQPHSAVEALAGSSRGASTTYGALAQDLSPGDTILIDDGLIKLTAISSDGTEVSCRVIEGGLVSDRKGINLPGARVSAPALTEKDAEDLRFALALGVDLVALSYVRRPEDADLVRQAMDAAGRRVPVIAKLEKAEAVEHLTRIVDVFDGIMVARGDLGVEMPLEQVPAIQTQAIKLARERARPVIVATQMLESMISAPRPTRAEVSDVAGAIAAGADAVMLSAETSVGAYPAEAVATFRYGDEFIGDMLRGECLCHLGGEFIRHVSVLGPVDQQSRRIVWGDIAHWAEGVERARLLVRIVAGQHSRPKALLPAIKIELSTGRFGFFLRDQRLLAVEGVRLAVPIARDVAIAPERYKRARTRVHPEAGHQREITSSGLTHHK